jgi:hypothetical protein
MAVGGAALLVANRSLPDESAWLGGLTLATGVFVAASRETTRRRGLANALAAGWLVLIGGEVSTRLENERARRSFEGSLIRWVDDPVLKYDLLPSVECERTRTNSLGMVDVERSLEKPAGTFRVACLGDSVGADCSLPGETTCAALEAELRARRGGSPVEGLNFSVFGYNTLQEARALEAKAAAFHPDAIVLQYVVNDPLPDLAVSHYLPGHLKFEHLLVNGGRLAVARMFPGKLAPFPWLPDLYASREAWDGVVVAGFDRIQAVAKQLRIPVVVAVFPLFLDPPWRPYEAYYGKVADEARRHGFIAVDLAQAAYRSVPVTTLLKPSRDAVHPNALAHELAARAIADALQPAPERAP